MKQITINVPDGYVIDEEKSTETNIILKPEERLLPKTYEKYCQLVEDTPSFCPDGNRIVPCKFGLRPIPSEYATFETTTAMWAFSHLIRLRDYYNDGWKPNWNNSSTKHTISFNGEKVILDEATHFRQIFTFKSNEIRNEFYKNFKDLLELVKILL